MLHFKDLTLVMDAVPVSEGLRDQLVKGKVNSIGTLQVLLLSFFSEGKIMYAKRFPSLH